ncbi:MAG: Serine/threonine-protein kinase PknB [candidate division BRC1 bacterium ADurb.BinA364]|nr:MAG: Serine/threonine-protein kinase PknB [candidate division BRC1 bacterium ADurb.BinA364]
MAPSSPFDSGETIDSPAFRPASSERDSASGASDRTHLASQISSASLENASALSAPSSAEEAPASIAYPQLIDRLSEERPSSAAEPPLSSASEEMLLQASAELAQGRPLEAYRLLRALPMNRESKDLLNRAAEALEGEGLFDEAVEVLRHINEYDFLLHEANRQQELELEIASELELADLHFKNRRFEAALEKYLHALEMGCADVDFATDRIDQIIEQGAHVETRHLLFMGDFFHRRGADEQALIYLNEVLEFDASNTDALRRIQAIFQERIRTHPERLELRLELGLLYLRVGKPSLAIPEFRRAGSIPQLAAAANRRLAEAYILNGQLQQALALYQRTELQTVDLEALYELAGRLEQARMPEDALKAFQAIEKIRDEYRDVQERKLAIREQLAQRAAGEAAAIEYDPKMRDLIGELAIGRYRYIGKLGSGGMGVVHRVFDIKNNTEVAMKILREGLANSQRALSRFIREAQYVDQLQHPNIVRLYDYNISKTPGQSFITMEYIDGPSMREMLETRFKDDIKIDREYMARIVSSVIQVCDALEAVHRKGIIHRDIKPDNIMINSRDEVKITDFGILHVEDGSYTETGALLGTPRYMAPEQVAGSKIDGRADIYAVGILLYEMLTSSPPFISGDIAYQQANTRPTPPREIIPDITPSLNQIIMTCLEKKPDQRYQSARALRAHLVEELQALGGAPPKRDSQANTIEHQTAEGLSGGLSDFDEDFE